MLQVASYRTHGIFPFASTAFANDACNHAAGSVIAPPLGILVLCYPSLFIFNHSRERKVAQADKLKEAQRKRAIRSIARALLLAKEVRPGVG